jgi:hypothetical protein
VRIDNRAPDSLPQAHPLEVQNLRFQLRTRKEGALLTDIGIDKPEAAVLH